VAVEELQPDDPPTIGPYRLKKVLGRGGMGNVYLGSSVGGRLVAVKVIRAEYSADREFRKRFQQEVAAARRVNGLYTAQVVNADVDAPEPWLATLYIDGHSLADRVAGAGPLPPGALRALAAGLAEGLAAIHAAGLVHRDLKPSNVLLAADGPRVIDFGISRALDATALTQAGVAIGTPGFMSPEQAKGGQVGPPSDVFSLGGVLTHAVAGHGPFGDGNPAAIMFRVRYDPPDLDGVPGGFRSLLARYLAKDPDERPAVARVLAELGDAGLARDWQGGKTPIPNAPAAPPRTETSRTPVPVRPGVTRSAPTPGHRRGARTVAQGPWRRCSRC
jgi:serine/threonine protein kinase